MVEFTDLIDYVHYAFKEHISYDREILTELVKKAIKNGISKHSNMDFMLGVPISQNSKTYQDLKKDFPNAPDEAFDKFFNEKIDRIIKIRKKQVLQHEKITRLRKGNK